MVACSAGCGARYCFAHRFPEQHNCPAAAAAAAVKAAAAAVKDEVHAAAVTAAVAAITSNEEKKQRGRKRTTAKKQAGLAMINLVKLKLSATGDKGVPAERRVGNKKTSRSSLATNSSQLAGQGVEILKSCCI